MSLFLFSGFFIKAQNKITGTVIDSGSGESLPGVTVLVKNGTQGAVTDIEGQFSISANPEDVLVISFLGYVKQEVLVGARSVIDVGLELDVSVLEELVVLGYSQKSQKELSASVTSLNAKELQNVTAPNVQTMLQGKVAGLTVSSPSGQPGQAADIRIRGITSLSADIEPLFVVDGMIGGSFVPSDVENITVLKDAAAIGLYGSQGAAGVIIVTTKQGDGAPTVSYSTRYGIKQPSFGNFEMMDGAELYETQEIMWGDDQVGFLVNRPGELEDRNFDWIGAAYSEAMIQTHNVSVRGSNENTNYGLSVEYFDDEGTLVNTGYERLNIRGNLAFDVNERFNVSTDINARIESTNSPHFSWLEDPFYNLPWDSPYNEDGSIRLPDDIDNSNWYGQFLRNFVNSAEKNSLNSKTTGLVWSFRMRYDLTDWLSLETRTRLSNTNTTERRYYSAFTEEANGVGGRVYHRTFGERSVLSTHFLRAQKTLGKHDIGFFVAHEGGYTESESLELQGDGLSSNSIEVVQGANTIYFGEEDETEPALIETGISYISEFSYGFDSKYFATLYYRVDGSSRFAVNKKYGSFYGGSAAWLLSDETFLSGVGALDLLKLRASYGLVGNSEIEAFKSIATYQLTLNYNGGSAGQPNNPASPDLGWETSKILNIGADIELFNEVLGLNFDVYQKNVEGMLLARQLAYSSGYEVRTENIGDMTNRGLELGLFLKKSFGDFSYRGDFNISFNDNEITKITDTQNFQTIAVSSVSQIHQVGEEAFSWYMPVWRGINPENGNPQWELLETDADGNVTGVGLTEVYADATLRPSHGALPTYTGGVNNSVSYKGVSLSFLVTFQGGNHIYNRTRESVDSDGVNPGTNLMVLADGWSRWEEPGDIATHPKPSLGGVNNAHGTSTRYLEKGDFVRLRNVTLSYALPQSFLNRVGVKQASVSLAADNLFTFTEFSGMDPDVGLTQGLYSLPGLSSFRYPISRQVMLGLNINF